MPKRKKPSERVPQKRSKRSMIKARRQMILKLHTEGKSHAQIADTVAIPPQIVQRELELAIDEFLRSWAEQSPQHTFVRYATFQFAVIRRLQQAHESFIKDKENKQYNAAISALRAQSDIYDKVLDKGINFGVIQQKKAKGTIREAPADIRIKLKKEITILSRLLEEVDNSPGPPPRKVIEAHAVQSESITYPIVVKPLTNEYGIVRDLPDWRIRKQAQRQLQPPASQSNSMHNEIPDDELLPIPDASNLESQFRKLQDLQSQLTELQSNPNSQNPPNGNDGTSSQDKEESKEEPKDKGQQETQYLVQPSR